MLVRKDTAAWLPIANVVSVQGSNGDFRVLGEALRGFWGFLSDLVCLERDAFRPHKAQMEERTEYVGLV